MIKKILEYCINSCYYIYRMKVVGVKNMERYSALDIATWFIYKTNAEKKKIKLLMIHMKFMRA